MNVRWSAVMCSVLLLVTLLLPVRANAHAIYAEYTVNTEVEIVATESDGSPLSGAQVTIYAPDNPSTPWDDPGTGICDAEGRYSFVPDSSVSGIWDVNVRLAGHQIWLYIDVAAGGSGGGGYTSAQIVLMSVCVVWGLVGTALYFRRRRSA